MWKKYAAGGVFVVSLTLLVVAPFLLRPTGNNWAGDADGTGTLAGPYDPHAVVDRAAQTALPEATQTTIASARFAPSNIPKPDETGVPTPPPLQTLPPMTPLATMELGSWRNCPAFKNSAYVTPAPGDITCPPTPLPTVLSPTPGPNDPFYVGYSDERSLDEDWVAVPIETRSSELVVIGTIQRVDPPRWTTADGRRPANPHNQDPLDPQFKSIVTPVELAVERYLKGGGPPARLLLWSFGGTIGHDVVEVLNSEVHSFEPGQRVVVFLKREQHAPVNELVFNVVARYTIVEDEARLDNIRIPLAQLLEWVRAAQ